MLKHPRAKLVLDHPNPRSLHETPTPRTGGIAVMSGIFAGALPLAPFDPALALAAALTLVSFMDDRRGLPVTARMLAHFAAALVFVALALPELSIALKIVIIFGVVWMTNLYNFMDGADGLAGGMTAIGFGAYALAAALQDATLFSLLNACTAAAAAAFLIFNFHPAKIFLGDAGSIPLGFFAASFGLSGWTNDLWPLWFPLLVFSPFIIDASVTLARRIGRREKVWQAHHSHYYQRLVRMGWGHGKTALMEYAVMFTAGASAIWALNKGSEWVVLIAWGAFYAVALAVIDYRWSRH